MKINGKEVWVVRNPNRPVLADIFWATTIEALFRYRNGCGEDKWVSEDHSIYDDEDEARQDAFSRLQDLRDAHGLRRNTPRPGGILTPPPAA